MEGMETDYFDSYNDFEVHKLMLQDSSRNKAYKEAIFDNEFAIKDKIVLDVGAGTGILSILCAQVGASKVYAVEASNICKVAEEVVKENGFANIIYVINNKIENVPFPEIGKVDIIISEWMGFYLLHEGMLDSVIYARDNFLKRGGLIFPEFATLYTAPCSFPDLYDYWNNIEGVSMNTFAKKLRLKASQKPETEYLQPDNILAEPDVLMWIDLKDVTKEELNSIKLQHVAVAHKSGKYQGICLWFTCTFPCGVKEPVILSTGPDDPKTHWKQTIIILPESIAIEELEPITYEISVNRSEDNERRYNIELTMLDPEKIEHPEYCTCHMTKCILKKALIDQYEHNPVTN